MRKFLRLAVLAVAVLALAACGSSDESSSDDNGSSGSGSNSGSVASKSYDNGSPEKGGVYRVGWEQSFGFTNNFDPTGEYLGNAWGLYVNLLMRPLVGYKHQPGAEGNELIGDLAESVPDPTNNGNTYTYKLRDGIKFGPPINREVTSQDVAWAMNRLANPKDGGQYSFYYTVIKGWQEVADGKADKVSGITTPDSRTIVFNLTKPTGDFNLRMSMPATAPIPEEVGECFEGKPGDYGRNLISSGPYMIEGSAGSFSGCGSLKPWSGYDGANGNHIILVRNPNYDQSTDEYRKNYPDRFEYRVNSNADDIYARVESGQLEDEQASPQPKTIRKYTTDPSLKDRLLSNVGDRTWYLTMNLTQAPFDDLHVRKAMNFIMDKQALRKAWGGPVVGSVATHIAPPVMYNNGLSEYDPYQTDNNAGDLEKAGAEMKQSKYSGGTEKCTAAACKNVLMIADTRALDNRMIPIVQASAAKLGITFKVRAINGAYTTIQTTNKNVPFSERPGWGKDYADPYTFFGELFDSRALIPEGNTNYSLVGITPEINRSKKLGVTGNLDNVPSVNADIDACIEKTGEERTTCWENLDKKMMTEVVPWVPYLWSNNVTIVGPKVTHWNYDQFSDGTAYSQVSVEK